MSDVVERAKAALEGVSDGPWDYEHAFGASFVCAGDRHRTTAQAWILRADTESGKRQDKLDARFVAQARTLVPELVAEVERLHTWDGLMSLVDEHYPTSIFPHFAGAPDNPDRDPGPRILSLLREVERLRAALNRECDAAWNAEARLRDAQRGY